MIFYRPEGGCRGGKWHKAFIHIQYQNVFGFIGEFERAREDLNIALSLSPDEEELLVELNRLEDATSQYRNKERKMFRRMFSEGLDSSD